MTKSNSRHSVVRTNSMALGYSYSANTMTRRVSVPPHLRSLCSCDAALIEDELIQLRESTKQALQASWDEVENLQNKNSLQDDLMNSMREDIRTLRIQLKKSKFQEDEYKRTNEKLLQKLNCTKTSLYDSVFPRRLSDGPLNNPSQRQVFPIRTLDRRDRRSSAPSRTNLDPISILSTKGPTRANSWPEQHLSKANNRFSVLGRFSIPGGNRSKKNVASSIDRTFHELSDVSPPLARNQDNSENLVNSIHSCPEARPRPNKKVSFQDLIFLNERNKQSQEIGERRKSSPNGMDTGTPIVENNDSVIRELAFKLKSRNETIASMEETILENIKTMQELHIMNGLEPL